MYKQIYKNSYKHCLASCLIEVNMADSQPKYLMMLYQEWSLASNFISLSSF